LVVSICRKEKRSCGIFPRGAKDQNRKGEEYMYSTKIMTALIAITFFITPALVYAADSGSGPQSQYQYQKQNTTQSRYQKNDSSLDGTGVKSRTRTQTTTTTRTRNRISR
jgi:preprotein translocase subunit SecF